MSYIDFERKFLKKSVFCFSSEFRQWWRSLWWRSWVWLRPSPPLPTTCSSHRVPFRPFPTVRNLFKATGDGRELSAK